MRNRKKISFVVLTILALSSSFARADGVGPNVKNCSEVQAKAMMSSKDGGVLWFSASWCPTCSQQAWVLNNMAEQKDLKNPMPICKVDYDTSTALKTSLRVINQSTFVKVAGGEILDKKIGITDAWSIGRFIER